MLLEQVSGKLEQVKLALAAIQAKELDLEEKEGKILTLKKQYSSNLVDLERVDHDIEEATRLRKFMIHLDKTLSLIKREARGCLLYTSPSPRDGLLSRMPSSA